VKFTPGGGRIEVRAHRDDCTVEIEVSDSGCGIRAAFLFCPSSSSASARAKRLPSASTRRRVLDVLVVEDDPASRETTSQMLEQRGAGVRPASSAAEAHAAVETPLFRAMRRRNGRAHQRITLAATHRHDR
jgi:PleD family two-component response regulator